MKAKDFFKPIKWKIIIFIILFVIIYLVPWFKVEVDPSTISMIASGRYPLIAGFLVQLIFFEDWLMGNFILIELLGFIGYLISFVVVYALSCWFGSFIQKKSFANPNDMNKKF